MSEVEVYEHDLHRLILNFFTVHGFQESAQEFSKETGLQRKAADGIGEAATAPFSSFSFFLLLSLSRPLPSLALRLVKKRSIPKCLYARVGLC